MIELLERADPANGVEPDALRLRAKVDVRIGLFPRLMPAPKRAGRPWLVAVASVAVVAVIALPVLLRQESPSVFDPRLDGIAELPGVDAVVPLASSGIQTLAVDGDTIWVMTGLANQLQRISADSGEVEASFAIDRYVEGTVVGSGYVWLMSYDNGGELLRFDPVAGAVDKVIPIGGLPGGGAWLGDNLWINNDQGELYRVSADGEIEEAGTGEIKGEGLGYLWVNDPETGLISSLAEDGTRGEIVVPTESGLVTADGWGVRSVTEAGGRLWLMDGAYPWGTNLSTFDPNTGELSSFGGLTFGLHAMTTFDGSLWVSSHTDHLVFRVDPVTGDMSSYPMPGKAGGLVEADGSLWVVLNHPGVLVRLDPSAGLIEQAEVTYDDWNRFPHRFLCTGSGEAGAPTIILEPADWIDYGSWSVIQAQLSTDGHMVCANGFVEGEATPTERAADLDEALTSSGIQGLYVIVASGDGVHSTRLFASGRDDIAGVVMVDPMPVGFAAHLDSSLAEAGLEAGGHPQWLDLDPTVSASLDGFGDLPLTVIGQDPSSVYLNPRFAAYAGAATAQSINDYWQDGLEFYAGLSTNTHTVVAEGTGMEYVLWDRPDLVVHEVLELVRRASGSG
jgi:hypothetical protein